MNKKKLSKKELFLFIMLPLMVVAFLIGLFFPNMENYWLRMVIIIGIMAIVGLILGFAIRRSKKTRNAT